MANLRNVWVRGMELALVRAGRIVPALVPAPAGPGSADVDLGASNKPAWLQAVVNGG